MPSPQEQDPSPAELFEDFFVPSLFVPWTRELLEYAELQPGERVLDLACATGAVARQVADRLGDTGHIVGLDISPDMLAVARDRAAEEGAAVAWRQGDATDLDLPDDSFDVVLCQQGIQFFDEPRAALSGVRRVLDREGRFVLSVWQPLEGHPVYRALLEAEAEVLGAELEEVATPFTFGEDARLRRLLDEAGFQRIEVVERTLDVEFEEPDTFVALTVMAGAAVVPELVEDDPDARAELIADVAARSSEVLDRYREDDVIRFPTPNYMATAWVQ